MKTFIFMTNEGFAQDSSGNDVDNSQVLGFGSGQNLEKALENFKVENSYIAKQNFTDVSAVEVKSSREYFLSL